MFAGMQLQNYQSFIVKFRIKYSRRPLFRTRKEPEMLFKTANVRNNQTSKKSQKVGKEQENKCFHTYKIIYCTVY